MNLVVVECTPAPTPAPGGQLLGPHQNLIMIGAGAGVAVVLLICFYLYCRCLRIKRNERPVFDGFEMGDAQQLEMTPGLEFDVSDSDFGHRAGESRLHSFH